MKSTLLCLLLGNTEAASLEALPLPGHLYLRGSTCSGHIANVDLSSIESLLLPAQLLDSALPISAKTAQQCFRILKLQVSFRLACPFSLWFSCDIAVTMPSPCFCDGGQANQLITGEAAAAAARTPAAASVNYSKQAEAGANVQLAKLLSLTSTNVLHLQNLIN